MHRTTGIVDHLYRLLKILTCQKPDFIAIQCSVRFFPSRPCVLIASCTVVFIRTKEKNE